MENFVKWLGALISATVVGCICICLYYIAKLKLKKKIVKLGCVNIRQTRPMQDSTYVQGITAHQRSMKMFAVLNSNKSLV